MFVQAKDLKSGDIITIGSTGNITFEVESTTRIDNETVTLAGLARVANASNSKETWTISGVVNVDSRIVGDTRLLMLWECEECRESAVVPPTFYEENGTPICSEGHDMNYVHTEEAVR